MRRITEQLEAQQIQLDEYAQEQASKLPSRFRIFKHGLNTSLTNGDVLFDEAAYELTKQFYEKRGQKRIAIDYEHKSTAKNKRAKDGRAAGWFTPEFTDEYELWASEIEWTKEAQAALADKQYAYYSPTFYSKDKIVQGLICVALTNIPALDGLDQIIEANMTEEINEASIDEVSEEDNANQSQSIGRFEVQVKELSLQIELKDSQIQEYQLRVSEYETKVLELSNKLAEYEAKEKSNAIESVIEKAIIDGKLTPAQKIAAKKIGEYSLDVLSEFIEKSPRIMAVKIEQKQVLMDALAVKQKEFAQMKPDEKLELLKTNPQKYNELKGI